MDDALINERTQRPTVGTTCWKYACVCCTVLAIGLGASCVYLYEKDAHHASLTPPPALPSTPPSPPPIWRPVVPTVTLNNGVVMPFISLGTFNLHGELLIRTMRLALKVGFNHFDTANRYGNEGDFGRALADVERDTVFVTTKVFPAPNNADNYNYTMHQLNGNLRALNMSYADLVLVHWPPAQNTAHCDVMREGWRAMEDFYRAGKARAIGVSNYCVSSLVCILKTATVTPAVNQVQYHVGMGANPLSPIGKLRTYHKGVGILTQAYSPLGGWTGASHELINGQLVTGIGAAHGNTGAQVSLNWLYRHAVPFSAKSVSRVHLEENLRIFTMRLTDEDMGMLDNATKPGLPGKEGQYSFQCH